MESLHLAVQCRGCVIPRRVGTQDRVYVPSHRGRTLLQAIGSVDVLSDVENATRNAILPRQCNESIIDRVQIGVTPLPDSEFPVVVHYTLKYIFKLDFFVGNLFTVITPLILDGGRRVWNVSLGVLHMWMPKRQNVHVSNGFSGMDVIQ